MALPQLTAAQREAALKKAAQARRVRAKIKADLKQRKTTLAKVLAKADKDEAIGKMKVIALLESLPRVGATTAAAIMKEVAIAPSRRIRGLGCHQREELIRRFS